MRIKALLLFFNIISILNVLSQNETSKKLIYYDSTIQVDSENIPLDSKQLYSPLKILHLKTHESTDTTEISKELDTYTYYDTGIVPYYSYYLYKLKEPLLFNKPFKNNIFRITYLMTFTPPIIISIVKDSNSCKLFYKYTNGKVGYEIGDKLNSGIKNINLKTWNEFSDEIQKMNFWSFEPNVASVSGVDGGYIIIEGIEPSRYQVTSIWGTNGKIGDLFRFLLGFTDIKLN